MLMTLNYRIMGAIVTIFNCLCRSTTKASKRDNKAQDKGKGNGLYDAEVKKLSPGVKNGYRDYHFNSVRRICLRIY